MDIPINEELISICSEISDKNFSDMQWSEIESGDMFQTAMYCGGYDADEKEFCFSYYSSDGNEFWFQFDIDSAKKISVGATIELVGVRAANGL